PPRTSRVIPRRVRWILRRRPNDSGSGYSAGIGPAFLGCRYFQDRQGRPRVQGGLGGTGWAAAGGSACLASGGATRGGGDSSWEPPSPSRSGAPPVRLCPAATDTPVVLALGEVPAVCGTGISESGRRPRARGSPAVRTSNRLPRRPSSSRSG